MPAQNDFGHSVSVCLTLFPPEDRPSWSGSTDRTSLAPRAAPRAGRLYSTPSERKRRQAWLEPHRRRSTCVARLVAMLSRLANSAANTLQDQENIRAAWAIP
jgi:hypothetical protein